ncbi:MAG TPA: DUF5660 family protein [Patescibacteria group bacterium]
MNTLQASGSKKKVQKPVYNDLEIDNPLKSLKNVGDTIVKSAKTGIQDAGADMWNSILGVGKYDKNPSPKPKMGGDLTPGQAVDLKNGQQEKQAPKNEAPMNYNREVAEAGQYTVQKEAQQMRQEVQSIIYELKRLAASTKAIQKDVEIAIGPSAPTKVGTYHKNFFEWMLIVIRDARQRVENSGAWLQSVKGKKKGIFTKLKKNMSQLMSGERSSSNQTG